LRIAPLLVAVLVAGNAVADEVSYAGEAAFGLWGGMIFPGIYDIRRDTEALNYMLKASSWKGNLDEGNLASGLAGGAELSWGLTPDLKLLLAAETKGTSMSGDFEGIGPNTSTDPVTGVVTPQKLGIDATFACWGIEAGATFLLRQFEDWSRIGLTMHAGFFRLTGTEEHWDETGPLGEYHQLEKYRGDAIGGMLGLEWEWLARFEEIPVAPGGYVLLGWRYLSFNSVNFNYYDSLGNKDSGTVRDANDDRESIDFSGPEVRFGLRLAFPAGQ